MKKLLSFLFFLALLMLSMVNFEADAGSAKRSSLLSITPSHSIVQNSIEPDTPGLEK